MKYFSTFSGIGGFEIGIRNAYLKHAHISEESEQEERSQRRIRTADESELQLLSGSESTPLCVGYSEIDKYAIKVYERQFNETNSGCDLQKQTSQDIRPGITDAKVGAGGQPISNRGHKNYGDITKINAEELPDFDCLVGGFPCQAFSIAGKRRGFEDTRGTLFFDLARILRAKQPRLFVFENVKGLLSHDNGNTFRTIIATIDELGYDVQWQVLNSKNHGVPQNRERIFIVGHLRGTSRPEVFPITRTNSKDIEQLNTPKHSNDRVYGTDGISPTLNTMQGGNRQPFIAPAQWRRTEKGKQARKDNQKNGKDYTPFGDGHREIVPKNSDVIGTITSQAIAKDSLIFAPTIRRLTPVECERLQGLPDNWTALGVNDEPISDTQRYKMCGNAVTTNVIQAIFERILV